MSIHNVQPDVEGVLVKPKRILAALTLALMVSGLSTWFVSRRLAAPPAPRKSFDVTYVAPSRALQAGEMLSADNTELVAWPGSTPVDGAFSHISDVIGRAILFPLAKNQPILDCDLSAAGAGTGLASKIPDGMRAVALRSDEVVGVAGFLVPGSHLDVLVTYRSDRALEPLTATVLQNSLVIATGHQSEPDPKGKTADVAVVTLLLTPEESQRAVLASSQGAIHFVMRNGGDASPGASAPTLLSELGGSRAVASPRVMVRPAVLLPAAIPQRREIETILGGNAGELGLAGTQHGGSGR
jgi:pilus assembly protein CpaB